MKSAPNTAVRVLLLAALLPACDITSPIENVNVRLNVPDAQVDVSGLGSLPLVMGQPVQRTATIGGAAFGALDAVHAIKLEPSFLTFRPAAADSAAAAGAHGSGTVLITLRSGDRPLLAAVATIANGTVIAIDPSIATLATAVHRIREHGAAASRLGPGEGALLGDWASLTPAALLATLESILAAPHAMLTLGVLPLSGDLAGTLGLRQFAVDATITARR